MSRLFTSASSQQFSATITVPATPFTMACWVWMPAIPSGATYYAPMSLSANTINYHTFFIGDGATGNLTAATYAGTYNEGVVSGVVANRWEHIAGVWKDATSRTPFLNGKAGTTGVTNLTPSPNVVALGSVASTYYHNGLIAIPVIWDCALNDSELQQLSGRGNPGNAVDPRTIRPQNLWMYDVFALQSAVPLVRSNRRAGFYFDNTGGVSVSSLEPPIRKLWLPKRAFGPVTAGGGATYTIAAAQGSYALSGQAAALKVARNLVAAQGAYVLTGQAAALRVSRKLIADQGSYVLSGQAADFVYTPTGGPDYTLTAAFGSYTLSGQAAALRVSRKLTAAYGSYVLTGYGVALTYTVPGGITVIVPGSAGSGNITVFNPGAGGAGSITVIVPGS